MANKFTPVSVVKKPSWMTPDFNPQIADKKDNFTPYGIISLLQKYLNK